jgi:ribosomal protein S27E
MFYTIKCKHCGNWQVKENRTDNLKCNFRCQRCGKNQKFIYRIKGGRNNLTCYGGFDNPVSAMLVCKRIKLRENTGDIEVKKFDLGFDGYA